MVVYLVFYAVYLLLKLISHADNSCLRELRFTFSTYTERITAWLLSTFKRSRECGQKWAESGLKDLTCPASAGKEAQKVFCPFYAKKTLLYFSYAAKSELNQLTGGRYNREKRNKCLTHIHVNMESPTFGNQRRKKWINGLKNSCWGKKYFPLRDSENIIDLSIPVMLRPLLMLGNIISKHGICG